MELPAGVGRLQYNAILFIEDERHNPRVVMDGHDETVLFRPCRIIDDGRELVSLDFGGNLFERYESLGSQPVILFSIPDKVHPMKSIAKCIYNVNA